MESTVQVLQLLYQLPENGNMASVINFDQLHKVECQMLARVYKQLPRVQRQAPFWIDISCNLIARCPSSLTRAQLVTLCIWCKCRPFMHGFSALTSICPSVAC